MEEQGLEKARSLTIHGFHYDNLVRMAEACREEVNHDRLLSAYTLNRFFMELSDALGDGPVMSSVIRKLEVKYRTAVNLALETAIHGEPLEVRVKHLTKVIRLFWNV